MNRLLILAGAAVLLVALIGGGALIGGQANVAVSVTPSPTAVPSPSTGRELGLCTAPVPADLQIDLGRSAADASRACSRRIGTVSS